MHEKFYCKMERQMTMFVEHSTKKGIWVCGYCRFTTSTPTIEPKMPEVKIDLMKEFYHSIVNKKKVLRNNALMNTVSH